MWGGVVHKPLLDFIKKNQDIDVFCFQETYHEAEEKETNEKWKNTAALNLFNDIQDILIEHKGFFRPHYYDFWGLSIFIKKSLPVYDEGEHFVHMHKGWVCEENSDFLPKNIQYVQTQINNKPITIVNFHGLWNGQGKTDTEDRISQSTKVLEYCKTVKDEFVLCGDFNLRPDTKSLLMFEEAGLRDLIKENGITSTRTLHYTKPEKFADYAFVTKGITVKKFEVLPDEVSDHAALLLEIDI